MHAELNACMRRRLGACMRNLGACMRKRLGAKYAEVGCKVYGDVWVHVYAFWVHVYDRLGACMRLLGACMRRRLGACMRSWVQVSYG